MSQSSFGKKFVVTTWGESHGKAIGAVLDGCPAGLSLCEEDIQVFLDRRKPGQSRYTTARKEGDLVEILSGVFEGKTTGTPISLLIRNTDQRSRDYGNIAYSYRPGHADFTFDQKYGFRDYRGGGRSSGRETAGRVAAGAIAIKLLNELGITFTTYAKSIGPVEIRSFSEEEIRNNALCMPDADAAAKASAYLEQCLNSQDSAGGVIECRIKNVPAGLGDTVFDKLDATLAHAIMSIGAVKAVEIGDGINVTRLTGSEDNDGFVQKNGIISKTQRAGRAIAGINTSCTLPKRPFRHLQINATTIRNLYIAQHIELRSSVDLCFIFSSTALAVNIDRISCSITAGKDINRIMQLYITAAIDINSLIPLFLGINTYTDVKDNLTSVIDINTIGFISVHLQITFTIL